MAMTSENNAPVGARKCALSSCGVLFTPIVYWQKCCCKEHASKLRWEKRKVRVNKALRLMEAAK